MKSKTKPKTIAPKRIWIKSWSRGMIQVAIYERNQRVNIVPSFHHQDMVAISKLRDIFKNWSFSNRPLIAVTEYCDLYAIEMAHTLGLPLEGL